MNQASGFRRVVRDIADLCELQIELLAVDGKLAISRSVTAIAILMSAAVFALSAVLAAVLSLAFVLHEQAGWTTSGSLLASAGVAAIIGGLIAFAGLAALKKAMSPLEETRSELAENLRWIKAAVVAPETSPRAQVSENSFRTRTSVGFTEHPVRNSVQSGNSNSEPRYGN